MITRRHLWLALPPALLVAWACTEPVAPFEGPPGSTDPRCAPGERCDRVDPVAEGGSGPAREAGNDAPAGTEGGTPGDDGEATAPNLKVALIADTASGPDFASVLQLVKREKADLVMIQGDLTYDGEKAASWFPVIDGELGATKIPFFVARGNHDADWGNLGSGLKSRMTSWGVTADDGDPTTLNYAVTYKGLKMVFVADSETSPTRADYVKSQLQNDRHHWKICAWHKNQRASNAGPKKDEMGWAIYEACRAAGAIVAQGHSHTYSRSKTLINDAAQTVDPACADPLSLCVGPGKHFFLDSSLGGHDQRPLDSTVAAKGYWASTFAAGFGALFLQFNVDGDPKKARGYFKTTGDVLVDPPPSSGKTSFTVTRQ